MSFDFKNLEAEAEQLVQQHPDAVKNALGEAGELLDQQLGGQYQNEINAGVSKVNEAVDGWAQQDQQPQN
jgi:hypothetical protein